MKSFTDFVVLFILIFSMTSSLPAQWVQTNGLNNVNVFVLAVKENTLFAGTNSSGVFLSTDNGINWTLIGLTNTNIQSLAVTGINLFVGTCFSGGIFLTTNNGSNWKTINTGLPIVSIGTAKWDYSGAFCFAFSGTNLFAGTPSNGAFLSTNNGTNWNAINSGLTSAEIHAFVFSGTNLFAGTNGGGVYLSTDNGTSWNAVNSGLNSRVIVKALAVISTNLFAGTGSGVYLSTNSGSSWRAARLGLTDTSVNVLAVQGTNLFAGTNNGGVFLSTNNGLNWTPVNAGLTNPAVYSLAINDTFLFAGTYTGVFRRPLSQMITSIQQGSIHLPDNSALCQNYPNPFNPSTTITFSVPSKSFVSLKIFDALGREVTTLIEEELPPGMCTRKWNALNISSGIYYYRLQAGSFHETKKLVLLR